MAIAYEQSRLSYGTGDTVNLAFTGNVKEGSLLLVVIAQYKEGGISSDTSVTDSQGNGYNKVGNRLNLGGIALEMFYAFASSSAACTVQTNPESTSTTLAIHEFSGITDINFIDQQDTNTATNNLASGGPITTLNANDLIFGAMTSGAWGAADGEIIFLPFESYGGNTFAINATISYAGSLYISLQNGNTNHQPDISPTWWEIYPYTQLQEYEDGDSYIPINTGYRIVSSTLTTGMYWGLGASWQWGGWIVAFKAEEEEGCNTVVIVEVNTVQSQVITTTTVVMQG